MKKRSLFIIPLALLSSTVFAQSEYDALRFSRSFQQGTARSTAMGGAFGALGGDVSCLAANPAGMSVYKRGEFTFTPQFINCKSEALLNGFESDDSKFSFKIANVGFVQSNYNPDKSGFKGWSWGIAFNRLMDFNGKRRVYGRNDNSSMLDSWKDRSNGLEYGKLDAYTAKLGYDCFLMDGDADVKNAYLTAHDAGWFPMVGGQGGYGEYQKFVSKTKGGLNSWDLAFSGNFDDKLYFGASIGIATLRYKQTSTYSEDDNDNCTPYEYWDFTERIKDEGAGVNVKAGVIYKPVNYLRFGAAIHTPTWYQVDDDYYSEVAALYDDNIQYEDNITGELKIEDKSQEAISENNKYKYSLMTPFKAILSAAFIAPGRGLLSIDYEYVNYSMTRFSNEDWDSNDFEIQNEAIKDKLEGTSNFRVGAEVKCTPNVALRAGYAIYGNPCKYIDKSFERQIFSGGVGIGNEDVFFDITGSYHLFETTKLLYESNNVRQDYNLKNKALYITMTVGLRF
ncbi:MAG: hypothetical protein II956_01500 [Bacteroidales bacterium]|nr:hypothetical protein [Bacteroidales bacterium]